MTFWTRLSRGAARLWIAYTHLGECRKLYWHARRAAQLNKTAALNGLASIKELNATIAQRDEEVATLQAKVRVLEAETTKLYTVIARMQASEESELAARERARYLALNKFKDEQA